MSLMSVHNKTLIHEGSRKNLYQGVNNDILQMSFKNSTNCIAQSDILHNQISASLFTALNARHISTHFIKTTSLKDQSVYNTKVLPIRIRITNIIHHEFHEQLGLSIGQVLAEPLIDIISDYTGTIIDSAYLPMLNICTSEQLQQIRQIATRINDILSTLFHIYQITPASIDLRFGIFNGTFTIERPNGIMLIDELTPNTIQFWNTHTNTLMEYDTELIAMIAPAIGINISRWSDDTSAKTSKGTQACKSHHVNTSVNHIPSQQSRSQMSRSQTYTKPNQETVSANTYQEHVITDDITHNTAIYNQDHHDMFAMPVTNKNESKNKNIHLKTAKAIHLDLSDKSIF